MPPGTTLDTTPPTMVEVSVGEAATQESTLGHVTVKYASGVGGGGIALHVLPSSVDRQIPPPGPTATQWTFWSQATALAHCVMPSNGRTPVSVHVAPPSVLR